MVIHYHCNSQDGNGYVSTSELKFVMAKLDVHFTDQVREVLVRMIFWESWFVQEGDTAIFFNTNLQELQEMVLEADIDGDGQVTEICTFFWPDLYQICAFVTRFLGDLRGVPCHDDCWIVCFLFRSSCCFEIQFPFFPFSDGLHLLPYWIPGGLIGAGAVWTKQDHQIYFSTSDPSLGPTLLPTDQLSHWNGNVRGRQVQTHRLWISNYKGLHCNPL